LKNRADRPPRDVEVAVRFDVVDDPHLAVVQQNGQAGST
jgi:hypothetical protein